MSDIDVQSGSGWRTSSDDPQPVPIVRMTATDKDGNVARVDMLPVKARRVGLDLIAVASNAVADTAVRAWARENGQDADSIVAWIETGTREILDSEGEA
jgi:hypothetical protein